jgi:ligand-binding sensor domain-containing protein
MEDRKGTLWFSSNAGLFSYSNHKLIDVSDQVGIQTDFVNKLFEDKHGELWVSTKKGLYHLKENKVYNITADKIEVGKGIGSIAEDKEGNIWFVANQHDLYIYDGKKLSEYQKSEENKGPVIFQIYRDQDDRLWFVGYGGAYRLENGKFLNITKNGPW